MIKGPLKEKQSNTVNYAIHQEDELQRAELNLMNKSQDAKKNSGGLRKMRIYRKSEVKRA